MAKSLFERYYTVHKKRAVMLDTQYRMVRTGRSTHSIHAVCIMYNTIIVLTVAILYYQISVFII